MTGRSNLSSSRSLPPKPDREKPDPIRLATPAPTDIAGVVWAGRLLRHNGTGMAAPPPAVMGAGGVIITGRTAACRSWRVEWEAVNIRMTTTALKEVDDWRRKQDDLLGVPEASAGWPNSG